MKIKESNFGVILMFSSGIFPFFVGSYHLFENLLKYEFSPMKHILFTNLIGNGVSLMVISYLLLEYKNRFLVWLYLFLIMWIAGNDSVALIYQQQNNIDYFPIAICPLLLGITGLYFYFKKLKLKI